MSDLSATNFARSAVAALGVQITVQRVSGYAPSVTVTASATVAAIVRQIAPDADAARQAGLPASMMGSIAQADRQVILMAADLLAQGFPAPVAKGDQIVLPDSAEILNVTRVDPYKRATQGAIELYAAGVS